MGKSVRIGCDITTGVDVFLSTDARQYSVYLLGTTGTGKSTLLENMVLQDMANGEGVCFIDPHGQSAADVLLRIPKHRQNDVIYWAPKDIERPFGLNPFFCEFPSNKLAMSKRIEYFISALSSLKEYVEVFANAPEMTRVMRYLAAAFIAAQGFSLTEAITFLESQAYREMFYPRLAARHPRAFNFWQSFDREMADRRTAAEAKRKISSTLNKLDRFQVTPVLYYTFGQPRPSLNFRREMDRGSIIIVDLGELGEGDGELIGAFVVFELMQAAFSRAELSAQELAKLPPFHLYADEFQRFMSTAFPRILDECRKYKLDCVLAHQNRLGQLTGESRASTLGIKNKIVFQVNSVDAKELAYSFDVSSQTEVTGRRPILTLSAEPWGELLRQNHANPVVQAALTRILDFLRAQNKVPAPIEIDWHKRVLGKRKSGLWVEFTYWDTGRYPFPGRPSHDEGRRTITSDDFYISWIGWNPARLTNDANVYLYHRQQGVVTEEAQFALKSMADWVTHFDTTCFDNKYTPSRNWGGRTEQQWADVRKHYPGCGDLWPMHSHEAMQYLYYLLQQKVAETFTQLMEHLGDLLALPENHILTESGQYEDILRQKDPDVIAAEIANELTHLPLVKDLDGPQVRCTFAGKEYKVKTYPPPKPEVGAEERTMTIKERSRMTYGRDWSEVEWAIEERIAGRPRVTQRLLPDKVTRPLATGNTTGGNGIVSADADEHRDIPPQSTNDDPFTSGEF